MIHCSCASEASRSSPIVRSATLTTVPSSIVIPEPSTAASTTARPVVVPRWTPGDPGGSLAPRAYETYRHHPKSSGWPPGSSADSALPRPAVAPTRPQGRSAAPTSQAMPSAVSRRRAGGLHDVAEHHPHHHVDATSRCGPSSARSYGVDPLGHDQLGRREQRLGVRGQQRQQLGVGAVGRRDDGVQQLVVLGELEHAAATPPGSRRPGRRGGRSKARSTTAEEPVELVQDHRLGQAVLGADLVVDRLPAHADPVGERAPS